MSSAGASSSLETTVAAIQVPASGLWDGNDGPWSTFDITVGTPPQPARVLVSTSVGETWVVSANKTQGGCLAGSPPNCPELRGGLVNVNVSSTWHDRGIFALGDEQNSPDYTDEYANGDYGFDALGIGLPDSTKVNFKSQTIAAIATQDWYLGFLGVDPQPTNFSAFENPEISFLSSLKDSGSTPSLSYAYSAGAKYRQNTTATLTLGGYDASRFIPTGNASFSMAEDISRDLVVGLQDIIINNAANKSLLPSGIMTLIDATVPHIWLPREACSLFENAFKIVYNTSVNRYLVNETLNSQLRSENASVSFLLGPGPTGGSTVNVTLPYSSFDLEIGSPFVNTTQRYFPLRRADNESQYTLGRTFLQEAYLIADYEHHNFSVYQNAWTPDTVPQIVSIQAVDTHTNVNTTTPKHRVPTNIIIGAVLGTVALCGISIGIALYFRYKRRARIKMNDRAEDVDIYHSKPEMSGKSKACGELHAVDIRTNQDRQTPTEMPTSQLSELEGETGISELKGTLGGVEKG